jgi:chemotaxis protein MotB
MSLATVETKMPRNKRKKSEGVSADWALSYGDLMTLLLTFFILIVSFSTVELEKVRRFISTIRGASGILGGFDGSSVAAQEVKHQTAFSMEQDILERVIEGAEEEKNVKMSDEDGLELARTSDGIMVRFSSPVLFPPGDSKLDPRVYDFLKKIAFYIDKFDCRVRIEGHTDNAPIRTAQFPTNWDLSSARAIQVLRFFEEQCTVPGSRLEAIGYGSSRPLYPTSDFSNRVKNRRVEIYLDWGYKSGKELIEDRQHPKLTTNNTQ